MRGLRVCFCRYHEGGAGGHVAGVAAECALVACVIAQGGNKLELIVDAALPCLAAVLMPSLIAWVPWLSFADASVILLVASPS